MDLPIRVHGGTHQGLVHDKNEDAFEVVATEEGGTLMIVCDGMGGMGHGEEASALAVEVLASSIKVGDGFPPERLRHAIRSADKAIREELCNDSRGLPGSTAVLVYIVDGVGHVAWAGDSRAYLVRNGAVLDRTRDHKLVEELVSAGQLTPEEAKASTLAHVVTRALGGRPVKDPAVTAATLDHPWKLNNGDIIVLCTDGVCDLVSDDELPELVLDGESEPEGIVKRLIDCALDRGGHDNITAIAAVWSGPDFVEEDAATPVFAGPRDFIPDMRLDRDPFLYDDDTGESTESGGVTEEIEPLAATPEIADRTDADPASTTDDMAPDRSQSPHLLGETKPTDSDVGGEEDSEDDDEAFMEDDGDTDITVPHTHGTEGSEDSEEETEPETPDLSDLDTDEAPNPAAPTPRVEDESGPPWAIVAVVVAVIAAVVVAYFAMR